MTRSVKDIADDLKQAVAVMGKTAKEVAANAPGNETQADGEWKIQVTLDDGRKVELGALADELSAIADDQAE